MTVLRSFKMYLICPGSVISLQGVISKSTIKNLSNDLHHIVIHKQRQLPPKTGNGPNVQYWIEESNAVHSLGNRVKNEWGTWREGWVWFGTCRVWGVSGTSGGGIFRKADMRARFMGGNKTGEKGFRLRPHSEKIMRSQKSGSSVEVKVMGKCLMNKADSKKCAWLSRRKNVYMQPPPKKEKT